MDAAHRSPCLFYSAKKNFHSSRVQPPAYPAVIPMVRFLPPCRLDAARMARLLKARIPAAR